MWYWALIGISSIVVSIITGNYIEKRICKRHNIAADSGIISEIIGIIFILLWVSLLLGVFIGKNLLE